jgi:hypothetical protein
MIWFDGANQLGKVLPLVVYVKSICFLSIRDENFWFDI